jgi:hypothetical protein
MPVGRRRHIRFAKLVPIEVRLGQMVGLNDAEVFVHGSSIPDEAELVCEAPLSNRAYVDVVRHFRPFVYAHRPFLSAA